jgi:hypothetical protein
MPKINGEESDSNLRIPQTQSNTSKSNIRDGIIHEELAIQSTEVIDSTLYLPDLGPQTSGEHSNDSGFRSYSRDEDDVELYSNVLCNPRCRPQSAQPISHSSMRKQRRSESNMGSGAPSRGPMFNRLRPATAAAIRYTENSVLRSRLDQVKVSLSTIFVFPMLSSQLPIKMQIIFQGLSTLLFYPYTGSLRIGGTRSLLKRPLLLRRSAICDQSPSARRRQPNPRPAVLF